VIIPRIITPGWQKPPKGLRIVQIQAHKAGSTELGKWRLVSASLYDKTIMIIIITIVLSKAPCLLIAFQNLIEKVKQTNHDVMARLQPSPKKTKKGNWRSIASFPFCNVLLVYGVVVDCCWFQPPIMPP
jgi:hypothetical protein